MQEIVQKLFINGKMATPKAVELIEKNNLQMDAVLRLNCDIVDESALAPLLNSQNSSSAPQTQDQMQKQTPTQAQEQIPAITPEIPKNTAVSNAQNSAQPQSEGKLEFSGQNPAPKTEVRRDRKKKLAEEYDVEFKLENCPIKHNSKKAKDFTTYFNSRYQFLQGLLMKRLNPMSISNLPRSSSESTSIIGMINEIRTTNNGNKMLILEDPTGSIPCLATGSIDPDLLDEANNTLLDEVVGITGSFKNNLFFIREITRPEVPVTNPQNKLDVPLKAAFISDVHFGSVDFLDAPFNNFLKWINSPAAEAVKYVFVAGDLCDGIGIYLGQENDLSVKNGLRQYEALTERLEKIPEHIKVIIIPGNHDIIGNHEPQQTLDYTALSKLPNAVFGTNPCTITLQKKLRILMYHGYSFDSVISELPRIRQNGYDKPCLPMLEVLKRRHLSPAYGGSLIIPENQDRLVIDRVPDIFHAGHLHTVGMETYRNVTLINSGTFQGRTSFQERMGHHPHPGIFACVDLETRKTELVNLNT